MAVHSLAQRTHGITIASQHVETLRKSIYPLDEKRQVNRRPPGNCIPRHGTIRERRISVRHDSRQHVEKSLGGDRGLAIERDGATTLPNDIACRWVIRFFDKCGSWKDRSCIAIGYFNGARMRPRFFGGGGHDVDDVPYIDLIPA